MTNNLKKLVIGGTEYNIPSTTYTAGENIEISNGVISANNSYIITESDMTKSTTKTYGVAPYNESYYYTNYTINANAGIKWVEGAWYTFVINTQTVASSYRNTRVRIGTGDYIPVMSSGGAILGGHSYFTKANSRCYQYSTRYESGGALHLMTDSNTTYSAMSTAEIDAGTGTTARLITPTNLKYALDNHHDSTKQDTLVSGTNIKTINNTSILGSGNISVGGISNNTTGTTSSVSQIWVGTETEYGNLSSTSDSILYFTF